MDRFTDLFEEMARRESAFFSWTRARALAFLLVPDFDDRMRRRMCGEDLSEADVQLEWTKHKAKLSPEEVLTLKNPQAEARRFAEWRRSFFESLRNHVCGPQCLRSVSLDDDPDIFFCVYTSHMHVCTHEHCETLRDTSDYVCCPITSRTSQVLQDDFETDPQGDMRRMGKAVLRVNSDSVRRSRAERLNVQEQMLLRNEFDKLMSRMDRPAPASNTQGEKRLRLCAPARPGFRFLESPRTRDSYTVPPRRTLVEEKQNTFERQRLFERARDRWFKYPEHAKHEELMEAFVFVFVYDDMGLSLGDRELAIGQRRDIWKWMHPAPVTAPVSAPVPTLAVVAVSSPNQAPRVLVQIAPLLKHCTFDSRRAAEEDGVDLPRIY